MAFAYGVRVRGFICLLFVSWFIAFYQKNVRSSGKVRSDSRPITSLIYLLANNVNFAYFHVQRNQGWISAYGRLSALSELSIDDDHIIDVLIVWESPENVSAAIIIRTINA